MLHNPVECLQIAKATFAFLDVRLNDIARITLARMPRIALSQFVGDKLSILAFDGILFELGLHLVEQCLVATHETCIQQGCLDGNILCRQFHAFGGRTERIANFEPHIPQGIEHILDDTLRVRRCLVCAQEQEIGVGGWRHHPTTVSTRSNNSETFGLCRVARTVNVRRGKII